MTHRRRAGLPWLTLVAGLLLASCSEVLSTDGSDIDHITVSPTSASLTAGEARTITAQAFDGDGQRLVGRQVFWSTQNASVATVSQSGVITGVASGNTQVAASSGGKSALVTVSVNARPVTLVRVTPSPASVQSGRTVTLVAEALDASGAGVPGRQVDWSTSNAAVATVSAAGVVTGVATGSATITATVDDIRGTSVVSVTAIPAASVSVTPNSGSIVQGGALQLTATVRDAQGNTLAGRPVTWSSSNESVASVSSSGRVVGVAEGSFTITARSDAASGTGAYSVTRIPVGRVTLSPSTASIAVGQSQPLTVSLFAADQVTPLPLAGRVIAWSSSNPSVATVSASGSVTGVSTGSATITAAIEGKSGTSAVSVTAVPIASIAITPGTASVVEGGTTTLVATARDANNNVLPGRTFFWSSSNAAQLSVTAGVVTAAVGSAGVSATITASAPGGGTGGSTPSASATVDASYAPVASVTVTPPSQSIQVGLTTPFSATLRTSGGQALSPTGRTVTWKSLNTAIATVNATTGAVTGVAQGGPVTIEVSASSPGQGTPVKATGQVTVGNVPVASVTVTPHASPVYVGYTRRFTAVTRDVNGNLLIGRAVQWGSLDNPTATVDALTGDVLGVATGPVIIRATSEGVPGDASINVTLVPIASVVVTPASASLELAPPQTQQLTAVPRDASNAPITGAALGGRATAWASSNSAVAAVSLTGLVTPQSPGQATMTATIGGPGGAVGTSTIDVIQSVGSVAFALSTLQDSLYLPAGQLTGTVTVKDPNGNLMSGQPVTITTPPGVSAVAAPPGTTNAIGQLAVTITGVSPGTYDVTATAGTQSGHVTVRVLLGMTSIALTPADDSLFEGQVLAFSATALGGTVPLADRRLNISSSASQFASLSVASVINTDASGKVAFTLTGKKAGNSLLTVSSPEGPLVNRVMRVLAPAASVTVSPATVGLLQDDVQTFTAVLRDAAGPSNVLTGRTVRWTSSSAAKLSIDPVTGVATALDSGSVIVTATAANDVGAADDVAGTSTVTITLPPIATVTFVPATETVGPLNQKPLTIQVRLAGSAAARGRFCSIASSAFLIASVTPSGLTNQSGDLVVNVSGLIPGSATITATCEGVQGAATVTVQ